jgi:hypothetical protein
MDQAQDSFEATMAALFGPTDHMADEDLVEILRQFAYRDGLAKKSKKAFSPWTPIHGALDAYNALKVSFVAIGDRRLFEPGPLHPRDSSNGVDIGPKALKAYADAQCAHGMFVWSETVASRTMPVIEDGLGYVADMGGFCDRFLATRFMSVIDPEAYAQAVASSPFAEAGRLMAKWWGERLGEAAVSGPDRPERVRIFEAALADIVSLVRSKIAKVDYHPDGCLAYALSMAGLPNDALEGWSKTGCVANLREGNVYGSIGYGAPKTVIGIIERQAA